MNRRRARLLVAKRELRERGRDKSFLVSTLFTLAIVVAIAVVPAFLSDGPKTHRLGYVGSRAESLVKALQSDPGRSAIDRVQGSEFDDADAASRAVEADEIDAAVVGSEVIVAEELDPELAVALQTTVQRIAAVEVLEETGATPGQAERVLEPAPLDVRALDPPDPDQGARGTIALIGAILLYGQIFGYGYWVAMGVMEEKASRVVEVILSKIRPADLLAGKIVGVGLLGLGQLAVTIVVGLTVARLAGTLDIPSGMGTVVAAVGIWFVTGYAFYSCLFAVAGALVSRVEELQNTTTPMSIVLIASMFAGFFVLESPDSLMARVISFFPPAAPIAMPARFAIGEVGGIEFLASLALSIGTTILLVPLAGKAYSGGLLVVRGRVKLKDAWRAA